MATKRRTGGASTPTSAADGIVARLSAAHKQAADAIATVYSTDGKPKIDKKTGEAINVASTAMGIGIDLSKSVQFDSDGEMSYRYPYVCPFGIPQIDVHLQCDANGRMGLARRIYIAGDRDIGKSTMTKRAVVNCLNDGGAVIFCDVDGQFDVSYMASKIVGKLNTVGKAGLAEGKLQYSRIGSFHELYSVLRSVVNALKTNVMEHAKANKLRFCDVAFTRDICPMLVVIDGFSSLFTLADSDKNLDEGTKIAGSNMDIHRTFKQLQTNLDLLGIPMILTGHHRMKSSGQMYWREPAFLTTLQDYVQVVLANVRSHDIMKVRDGVKYIYATNSLWRFMKLKASGPTTGLVGPIKFVKGRGYDIGYDYLSVLDDAGFLSGDINRDPKKATFPDKLQIVETNKVGDKIPDELLEFVSDKMLSKGEWIKAMKANDSEMYRNFTSAMDRSLRLLTPMLLKDYRELGDGEIIEENADADDDEAVSVEEDDGSDGEESNDEQPADETSEAKKALKRRGFSAPK